MFPCITPSLANLWVCGSCFDRLLRAFMLTQGYRGADSMDYSNVSSTEANKKHANVEVQAVGTVASTPATDSVATV